MIKVVFFDMGGTLVFDKGFSQKMHEHIGRVLEKEAGIKPAYEELTKLWLSNPWESYEIEYWDLFRSMLLLKKLGVEPRPHLAEKVYEAVLEAYKDGFYLDEDVYSVFRFLKEKGLKIGIISNVGSYEILSERLEYLGLKKYVDVIVASQAVVWKKPDRRIFEIACYLASAEPSEAVHVGDDPVLDIMGAKKVGMRAIQVLKAANEKSPIADAWVSSVKEVKGVIEKWI